ncbi:hypothetical protein L249_7588 [Ophiocordyceps polyrhachis-furcata BCC 54312]|uniref:Uncharacterized protein n=1 Tax=Ophiocordyceps polyrhachis-furcata BCC 54312 TaxID=1330021 RepID=A0A367LAE0_9HYPO|nr:hypothetical protein L249_7588 [Ophiocordyceps polyrhachis-furcata BCC 54312]
MAHPTLVNIPPPGSNPETPSEMPGTPTSTTTSLSALSTTAIKDGHRGHFPAGPLGRGHQHSPSSTSLEAERADRISRLAGLERVSALRPVPPPAAAAAAAAASSSTAASFPSPQTTPTSAAGFPPGLLPASHQLTPAYFDSRGQPVAMTKMSTVGSASATESQTDDARTTAGDEDMLSTGTNYRDVDPMDEDGFPIDDRMSDDDGSASLVGFGEGAGSTVSGPIYHRRPPPNAAAHSRDRDMPMAGTAPPPDVSDPNTAIQDRRHPRNVDGVAADPTRPDDGFVDTTIRGPVPVPVPVPVPAASRPSNRAPAAENLIQPLEQAERTVASSALGSPGRGGDSLGKFYSDGGDKSKPCDR